MRHERVAQLRGEADGRARSEILRRDGADEPHQREDAQPGDHAQDVGDVVARNATVDDRGDDQRDDQLEGGLQQLEERAEHALLFEVLKVDEQFFQISHLLFP